MSHGHLTLDDIIGFVMPLVLIIAIIGCCLYALYAMIWRGVVQKLLRAVAKEEEEKHSSERNDASTSSSPSRDCKSVFLVLLLSYWLAPLLSHIPLMGKRHNQSLAAASSSFYNDGLFDLIMGQDTRLQQVIAKMSPLLLRGPRPPWLFSNRHLQFIPWLLQNEMHRLEEIPFQTIELNVTSCLDKSLGIEHCHSHPSESMTDTITIDVFPPFDDSLQYPNFNRSSPLILFNPGLRCYSQDMPGNSIIRLAYGAGFRSVVLNRRGHSWPPRKLQAPRWNLFGDVYDLEQVYWFLLKEHVAKDTPMFLHGISSGTALVVSALAEWDQRNLAHDEYQQQKQHLLANCNATTSTVDHNSSTAHHHSHGHQYRRPAPSFVASVSVTPGYDISRVLLPERFKNPYNFIMTQAVQDHFVRFNEDLLRQYNSSAVDAVLQAKTLQQVLNAAVPFAGYASGGGVDDYYRGENPVNHLQHISTPKLVLNSIDDPCCNIHNVYEASPYAQHGGQTYAQIIAGSQRAMLAVTKSGSHCPFLDTSTNTRNPLSFLFPAMVRDPFNGGWMLDSWADRVAMEFYQATLEVYHERRYQNHRQDHHLHNT